MVGCRNGRRGGVWGAGKKGGEGVGWGGAGCKRSSGELEGRG